MKNLKLQTMEVLTHEAYQEHIAAQIDANHKTMRNGIRRGGVTAVAQHYGEPSQIISNVQGGFRKPTGKMLKRDGLEKLVVYVPETQGK